MMASQENTTHVVVQYRRQFEVDKILVDLVPRTWVIFSSTTQKWICKYPQPKDAMHVIKWVKESIPPKKDFFDYEVHIIKEADSYKIGLKYLKESYRTAEIRSIDGDLIDYDPNDPETPKIYSQKDVRNILNCTSKKMVVEKSPDDNGPSTNRKSEKKRDVRVVTKTKEYAKEKSHVDDEPSNQKSGKKRGVKVLTNTKEFAKEKSSDEDGPSNRKKKSSTTKSVQRSVSRKIAEEIVQSPPYSDDSSAESDTEAMKCEMSECSSNETAGVRSPPSPEKSPSRQVDESSHGTLAKPDKTANKRQETLTRLGEPSTSRNNQICSPGPRTPSPRRSDRDPPVVASLTDLKDLEKRINAKINSAKRSILYNMGKIYRAVKAHRVTAGNGASRDEEASLEIVLDMRFPVENITDFETLEEKLKAAEAKTVMKKYMSLFACGTTPQEDIANILPELMRKNVQLLFSGSGKVQKGKGKRNFSITETYSCMEEILRNKYTDKFGKKQIKSHTGTWLSRAGDREGGKNEREAKAAAGRTKRTANDL